MKYDLEFAKQVARAHPSTVSTLLAVATLMIDFATGREIRFPLLFVLPAGLAAWAGRKKLGYALSVLLPLLRVTYEVLIPNPEQFPVEGANAAIEALALSFYVYLLSRKGAEKRQMSMTILERNEEVQHLRSFTRIMGATLQGRGISPGLAEGVAVVFPSQDECSPERKSIAQSEVERELDRLGRALQASVQELEGIVKRSGLPLADKEIAFVDARMALLGDPSLISKCKRRVSEDLVSAEQAVAEECQRMEEVFLRMKQEFMRQRGADVRDMGRQILRNLSGSKGGSSRRLASLPPGTVLVMEELPLADVLEINPAHVSAIVTERMGPASHVAILARGRHIPAVCDIKDATTLLTSGEHVLVDAVSGTVTVAPTQAQSARFASRKAQSATQVSGAASRDPIPHAVTQDGVPIALHANIGRADEAVIVQEYGLEGVGLFRSEFLFLSASHPPDLEAQTAAYTEVASLLNPLPVVIRTMDLGGDKIPLFNRTANDLAFGSGLRGLAYSLSEKELFRTQLRALCRAAQKGNVKIMFPMVMGVADMREARQFVEETLQSEPFGKRPPVGAMIETPAAAFGIEGVLQVADFVCIGTNDLSHSILAMDRESLAHPGVLPFLHPSVLRAVLQVVRAAAKRGVPVSVCGEAASDPAVASLLIGMGVRVLSMNPFQVKRVRHAVCQLTLERAESVARRAVEAATPQEIQNLLAAEFHGAEG